MKKPYILIICVLTTFLLYLNAGSKENYRLYAVYSTPMDLGDDVFSNHRLPTSLSDASFLSVQFNVVKLAYEESFRETFVRNYANMHVRCYLILNLIQDQLKIFHSFSKRYPLLHKGDYLKFGTFRI